MEINKKWITDSTDNKVAPKTTIDQILMADGAKFENDYEELKNKIDVTLSGILTLTADGWTDNRQTLTFLHDTAKLSTIIVEPESLADYGAAAIYPISETYNGIVFRCTNTPTADIKIRIKSEVVRNA